jgi:demethylmenaquinone methyltransferase/2-methoxy-6-polyprenyl-1,4-benzoquinol methylase
MGTNERAETDGSAEEQEIETRVESKTVATPGFAGLQKAEYVESLFARIAPHYDLANGFITAGLHRAWRRATVQQAVSLLTGQRTEGPVSGLDLCCGTGDYVFLLREGFGEQSRLVGLDFCEPMIREAIARTRRMGIRAGASWIKGDATNLAIFRDGTFDVATVGFGLRNVVDLPATLREAARVLRPGGIFISLELTRPQKGLMRPVIFAYLRWLLPILARMAKGGREDYLWLRWSLENFPEAGGLSNLLESSGFQVVQVLKFGFGAVAAHIARRT